MVGRVLRFRFRLVLFAAIGWHLAAPSAAVAVQVTATELANPTVQVRVGEHGDFDRMVFDWVSPVPYRVEMQAGQASVIFERPARLDLSRYRKCPPPLFKSVKVRGTDHGLAVDLEIPPGAKLRHFITGTKVVIDVLAPET